MKGNCTCRRHLGDDLLEMVQRDGVARALGIAAAEERPPHDQLDLAEGVVRDQGRQRRHARLPQGSTPMRVHTGNLLKQVQQEALPLAIIGQGHLRHVAEHSALQNAQAAHLLPQRCDEEDPGRNLACVRGDLPQAAADLQGDSGIGLQRLDQDHEWRAVDSFGGCCDRRCTQGAAANRDIGRKDEEDASTDGCRDGLHERLLAHPRRPYQ
mmetsp:Transcript_102417/g.296197  ORF Transcript_102417/g.296197 Transcript_102417/m.296197 type:complete len:211 (-) Transcript_102417:79-711(-)